MRPDLPKLKNCRVGLSTLCFAWLVVATCLAGARGLAAEASTNDPPAVANAVAELDAEVNTWLARATDA
ncbi:MAG: hypothetical protein WCS01_13020, partial [bacterium]